MSVLRTLCGRDVRAPGRQLRFPLRGQQTPAAIGGQCNPWLIQFLSIPKFAGHLLVGLIQRFAIVCVGAAADFIATAELHGTVHDSSGAVIPNAAITIVDASVP